MPLVSVLMNTARSGYSMTGFRDTHHFAFTIEALKRQTFRDFEFIISDYVWENRKKEFDFSSVQCNFPIYHVPITHSRFKDLGYVAIAGCKNNAIMYSSGEILVFLDDCSAFESNYLSKIVNIINVQKTFPNPLHVKNVGYNPQMGVSGQMVKDCRFVLFDHYKKDIIVNNFHLYGYMTCTRDAAMVINGFDEMFDGSRQLEDIDFGERLKLAGYSISLHKNLVVTEQEHSRIDPNYDCVGTTTNDPWHQSKVIEPNFKESLKCNGPYLKLREERSGSSKIMANAYALTPDEASKLINCYKFSSDTSGVHCAISGRGCNWSLDGKLFKHMTHIDSSIYIETPPIFNLAQNNQIYLVNRHRYRVK